MQDGIREGTINLFNELKLIEEQGLREIENREILLRE